MTSKEEKIKNAILSKDKKIENGEKRTDTIYYRLAVTLLAIGFGFLHGWHVSTLFENDRHFSHLSDIEREMSFRTEMGMYYSYYKIIAEANNISSGIEKLLSDNISEYPNVIDATMKYSLLPEVTAGSLYHIGKDFGLLTKKQCWQIERGDELPPVLSCEGMEVPIYFYLEIVWFHATFTGSIIFLYATYLSGSVYGGLLAIFSFFYNHNECTRIQWTPPLRESFAYPALLYQMYRITEFIRGHRHIKSKTHKFYTYVDIFLAMMYSFYSWQFSQFVFLTQIIVILFLKWIKIIPRDLSRKICLIHGLSALTIIMDSENTLLSQSLYWCLLFSHIYCEFISEKLQRFFSLKSITWIEIFSTIIATVLTKIFIIKSEDDNHIFQLLMSKLTKYKDFHTMLYTCAPEFDFLQYETFKTITVTFLLPTVIIAGLITLYYWYRNFKKENYPNCIEPEIAYSALQCGAFILMAVFIMRLKLFMTPHLCIISGLVIGKRYLAKFGLKSETSRAALVALILALMTFNGMQRLQEERNHVGEYMNIEQEELFEWIKLKTPKNAVFAGKMSLMANLMLSTGRPIVNNPYYENKEMRDRTMKVYEMFSRKEPVAVYETLRKLHVDYVVLDENLCFGFGNVKPGCRMVDLMDLLDNGKNKKSGKPPVCPILYRGYNHLFRKVFSNQNYVVLSLEYSKYVEIKPKKTITYQL
ncbi:probable C-mannosyltransferase DPY19L1 [Leptopilina heterotoma]|uniref:probable C-mannosyltransferase DPY19L1 n=1 Tax=Leptopilina heterotoma TaxID=63436 RepID=UPI001CA8CFDA|nr:probable C-mannosyltransferase DPY19L1 [Leptopilina heterotoma]